VAEWKTTNLLSTVPSGPTSTTVHRLTAGQNMHMSEATACMRQLMCTAVSQLRSARPTPCIIMHISCTLHVRFFLYIHTLIHTSKHVCSNSYKHTGIAHQSKVHPLGANKRLMGLVNQNSRESCQSDRETYETGIFWHINMPLLEVTDTYIHSWLSHS
jgi:hypothetical protein